MQVGQLPAPSSAKHRAAGPRAFALALSSALLGCATPPPPARAPGLPPSPSSITSAHPGGDAADPERAALDRLVNEPLAPRTDFWKTLHVSLPDGKKWRRVRLWGQPTRATYRYGQDHYAVASIWYQPIEGDNSPDACLAKFLDKTVPLAKSFDVKLGPPRVSRATQLVDDEPRPMLVEGRAVSVSSAFASDDYVRAVVAYQSWPGTCLVQGFAVVATRHRELAARVRDRWVSEAAPGLLWNSRLKEAPDPTKAR